MTEAVTPFQDPIRERVIVFLLFLTSDACRSACARRMPPESVAYELCRIWFDEIYTPGRSYLFDGFKGNYSEDEVEAFENRFTGEEMANLDRFHAFLDLRMDMLRPDHRHRQAIPLNDMWENIIRDAAYLVEDLEPDAQRRQALLAALVQQATGQSHPLPDGFTWQQLLDA